MAEPWDLTPTRVKKRLSSTYGVNNEAAPKKPKITRPGAISRRKQCGLRILFAETFLVQNLVSKNTVLPVNSCVRLKTLQHR